MSYEKYRERIKNAVTIDEMNEIIEEAAVDDGISNADYSNLYGYAIDCCRGDV